MDKLLEGAAMRLRIGFGRGVRFGLATMMALGIFVTATSTTGSAASVMNCRAKQLVIAFVSGGAGAGHLGLIIKFENSSALACTLSGYPSVIFQNAAGTKSVVARETQNGYLGGLGRTTKERSLPVVTLGATTGVASILIEGTDVPSGGATKCVALTKIALQMPGFKKAYHFTTNFPGCSTPQVHPIVKGSTGQMA